MGIYTYHVVRELFETAMRSLAGADGTVERPIEFVRSIPRARSILQFDRLFLRSPRTDSEFQRFCGEKTSD